MKRVLSLVLALVLVLGMIPTFAAEKTGGEELKALGLLSGNENGDLMEDQTLERQEFAKVIAQLNGALDEAAAYVTPGTYADFDKVEGWARNYVAYAEEQGWMTGKTGNMFDPAAELKSQELLVVLLRVLGYDDTWSKVFETAAEVGLVAEEITAITRGDAFELIWTAVSEVKMANSDMTLGVHLGVMEPAQPEVPATLEVVSVNAANLKQIEVVFNRAVDEETAELISNYKVKDASTLNILAGTATLQADSKTVIITLTNQMANQSSYTFEVANVKDADGTKLAATYTQALKFIDVTIPTFVGVTRVALNKYNLEFSEPVRSDNSAMLKYGIKIGSVNVSTATISSTNPRVIVVTTPTNLTVGTEYTFTINAAGTTAVALVKDLAGLSVDTIVYAYTPAAFVGAPAMNVIKTEDKVVWFNFDRPVTNVTDANVKFRLDNNNANFNGTVNGPVTLAGYENVYTFSYNASISAGDHNLIVAYTSATGKMIQDIDLNKVVDATAVPFTVIADTTAPTITSVVENLAGNIEVTFSESVNGATTPANYVLKNAAGTTVNITSITLKTGTLSTYVVVPATALEGTTTLTVVAQKIYDSSFNKNYVAAVTETFEMSDASAPAISKVTYEGSAAGKVKKIYVIFSEDMQTSGANSILAKTNYEFALDEDAAPAVTGTYTTLGLNDVVALGTNAKTAVITFATEQTIVGGKVLGIRVAKVADLAGNTADGIIGGNAVATAENAVDIRVGGAAAGNLKVTLMQGTKQFKVTGVNTLEFYTDTHIASVDVSKIYYTPDGGTTKRYPTSVTFENSTVVDASGAAVPVSKVVLTFTAPSATVDTFNVDANAGTMNIAVDAFITTNGTYSAAFAAPLATLADYIAPAVLAEKDWTTTTTTVEDDKSNIWHFDTTTLGSVDTVYIQLSEPVVSGDGIGALPDGYLNTNIFDVPGYVVSSAVTKTWTTDLTTTVASPATDNGDVVVLTIVPVAGTVPTTDTLPSVSIKAGLLTGVSGTGNTYVAATTISDAEDTMKVAITTAAAGTLANTHVLTFSEALFSGTTAVTDGSDIKALFTVDNGATVSSAIYNAATKTVTLTTTGAPANITVTAAMKDASGNGVNAAADNVFIAGPYTIN